MEEGVRHEMTQKWKVAPAVNSGLLVFWRLPSRSSA
jgi:hypothetical protein